MVNKKGKKKFINGFPPMSENLCRAVFCEYIGTFFLILAILCSIAGSRANENIDELLTPALATSGTLLALIDILGPSSGCHVNPVVTLAAVLVKNCHPWEGVFYALAQFFGGLTAAGITHMILPQDWIDQCHLGVNKLPDHVTEWQGLLVEILGTTLLVLMVLAASDPHSHKQNKTFPSLSVSVVLLALILFTGPISSGSFNPVRSVAPALVLMKFHPEHWIFWVGPIVGSVVAVLIYQTAVKQGIRKNPTSKDFEIIPTETTACLEQNLSWAAKT